jgi:outer membrane protein TolC
MLFRHVRRLPILLASLLASLLAVTLIGAVPPAAAQDTDPPTPVGGVLTLRDCVAIALDSSANLRIRAAELEIADENVTESWGALLPNLNLNGSYNKSDRTDFDSEYPVYGAAFDTLNVQGGPGYVLLPGQQQIGTYAEDVKVKATSKNWGASANINLFDGLANINRIKSSQASREAAEYGVDYTREQVIQNVAVAYYDLLRYLKLQEVATETRDEALAQLERTETYFRLGSAAKSEVLQQRVRVEQTRYDLVVAENRVEQSAADLAYAMNQPLAARVAIDTSPLQTEMVLEDVQQLYAEALENRLDLLGTEAQARAADYSASAAGGNFWPRLDLYAQYRRSYDESPYKFGSQESQSWAYGGQVSWDVFNRFQNWTNRGKAKAQARIAEYQHEQAALDAQIEVRQYHNAMREAIEKQKVAAETITQAQEELRLAQERFRVGAGTQLDRINAEVSLASARAEEVQAVCDYLISRARLWRAVGRLNRMGRTQ